MLKQKWVLIAIALLLAGFYVYHFSNWFKPKIIPVSYTERTFASRIPSRPGPPTILFGFGGQRYQLTEVEVVQLAAWQTNHAVLPAWHLIATSKSAPMEFFRYGQNLPDMKPAIPGAHPESLASNVTYRLLLRAGHFKGQCDFQLGARPPATTTNQ